MERLELKVQLLAEDAGKIGDLKKQLSVRVAELASTICALEAREGALKRKHRSMTS